MKKSATEGMGSHQVANEIETFVVNQGFQRKPFERKWYDNNFFYDGFHYRYVSRVTDKVIDISQTHNNFMPHRAIPKASRQLQGVVNLMLANEWTPVAYPEKIVMDPNDPQYEMVYEKAKNEALRTGQWVQNEWKNLHIKEKIILMALLAGKNCVAYMQIYPDAENEEIKAEVYDAFDIYLKGNLNSIYESPFIVKACPKFISEIKANPNFDEDQVNLLSPDNKYASSEIKQAYMQSRFGFQTNPDSVASLLLKEAYIKEYISEDNMDKVAKDLGEDYKEKEKGDCVIRQVFEAGGIWLSDKYLSIDEYPFIDLRLEPGPIYQTALIERFIPANKSLDIVMSRLERHVGTMVVGAWLKRRGENYHMNNVSGGLEVEYDTTPPVQAQAMPIPSHVFSLIELLNSFIEEQGASTAALGQLPSGVKSGTAIESLKATEYANLKIPTDQLKETVRRIAERMIDIGANYFMTPKTVYQMKDGEPDYFDVIGERGAKTIGKMAKKKMMTMPNAIPLKADTRIDIQIESGLGFTEAGKRETMLQIVDWMDKMAKNGYLTQPAVALVVKKFLEIFKFGSTQEFMEAMKEGTQASPLTNDQVTQMKVAILEALKEAGEVGPQASEKRITENKIGVIEGLKESGLADKIKGPIVDNPETAPIPYKDAPPSIKRQMEIQAGFEPATDDSPIETEQKVKALQTAAQIDQANRPKEENEKEEKEI